LVGKEPMIVNIRGTSGSGKSTIVKKILELAPYPPLRLGLIGRKSPLGYFLVPKKGTTLFIPGHYETACGGCDTIASLDQVYSLIEEQAEKGFNVLYEGIMASGEYRRCVELHKRGYKILAIGLTTPLEQCLEAIKERRKARGDETPFNPARTIRRNDEVRRMLNHLVAAGIHVKLMSRENALQLCINAFLKENDQFWEKIG
jgi:predicted kinase